MPAAVLFAADPTGALHVRAAVGTWGGDAGAVQALAERLGRGVGVVEGGSGIEGARFVAGARLGDREGALLVFAPDDRTPTEAWTEAFATSARAALAFAQAAPLADGPGRILHEVSAHPGSFDDRLALALRRSAEVLALDGAAFARVEDGQWVPQAVYDPSGALVPTRPIPVDETFCAVTIQTDGPFAVEDAAASALAVDAPAAYLAAPVFVGGRCVGTFSVAGHRPRARPFDDDARALVEALARWLGMALDGRLTARDLADREADLSAFFDAAPMGMGVARLLDDDLEFLRVNAAAAAVLGAEAVALVGRRASAVGVGGRIGRRWLAEGRRALAKAAPVAFETVAPGPDGPRTLATTLAPIADADDARFSFVVEDVTGTRRAAERAREGEAQIEALVGHAPVALFAADSHGRLAMSRGRILGALGLDAAHAAGHLLADVFADVPGAAPGIEAALGGQAASWTVEADGRVFEVRVSPRWRDGAPAGFIGVALDVTDRQGALRAAEAAAEARRGLLKHLHHEIRSPLTSILGYADLLGLDTPPEEVVEVRDVIARASERLLAALDELMRLGDEGAGHPVPTPVVEVVAAIAEATRPAAEARRIALNLWCTIPEGPLLLDAGLFERIVRHLVSGAVASAEGARVDVRLETDGPDGLRLTVEGGAPADVLGMGADYVPRLAEALGGEARPLDRAPGWSVRLPRRPVPVVDLPAASDGAAGEAPSMAMAPLPG